MVVILSFERERRLATHVRYKPKYPRATFTTFTNPFIS
jgi:hypothetical protein